MRRTFLRFIAVAFAYGMDAGTAQGRRKTVVIVHDAPFQEQELRRHERWFRQEGLNTGKELSLEYVDFGRLRDAQEAERKARAIVAARPDVIVIDSDQVFLFQRLTRDIPLVFVNLCCDPVRLGFVRSLNHPGGNMTGTGVPLVSKAWEVAKALRPRIRRMGILAPSDIPPPFMAEFREMYRVVAQRLQLQTVEIVVPKDATFARVERAIRDAKVDAIDVGIGEDVPWHADLVRFLERSNIVGVWADASDVEAGGLLAVHPDFLRGYWDAAKIAARILKGAKAAETPVQIVELIHTSINLRTAKAMGIEIPASVRTGANLVFK